MPDPHHRLKKYQSSYPSAQIHLSEPGLAGFFNVSEVLWAGPAGQD